MAASISMYLIKISASVDEMRLSLTIKSVRCVKNFFLSQMALSVTSTMRNMCKMISSGTWICMDQEMLITNTCHELVSSLYLP